MSTGRASVFTSGVQDIKMDVFEADIPQGEDKFIWVDLLNPSQEEFEHLQEKFSLHPLSVEDAMSSRQVPKIDLYDHLVFTVFKTAVLSNDTVIYNEISAFLSSNFIIIVRHGEVPGYDEFCTRLASSPPSQHMKPDFILHAVLDFIVDSYLPIMQMIEDAVLGLEQQMLESFLNREQITRIFRLRREVIHFQRIIGKMLELGGKFVHLQIPCIGTEVKPYFNDVTDHLVRLDILGSTLIDIITSVFEASNLFEQQRQGTITRQLAAWAGILAAPTAIAGIYGMNFENIPELSVPYGYQISIIVMVLICVCLYLRFKKSGWL